MGPLPEGGELQYGEGVECTGGGGHAGGSGAYMYGQGCRDDIPASDSGYAYDFASLGAPYGFGGPAAGLSGRGRLDSTRGGGRVWLQGGGTLLLAGSVSADGGQGAHQDCGESAGCGPGGGGGGSIYLGAWNVTVVSSSGYLSASGGDSVDCGGGGSGSVAVQAFGSAAGLSVATVNITGGITLSRGDCPQGGTGSFYLTQLEQLRSASAGPRAVYHDDGGSGWAHRVEDARSTLRQCEAHLAATRHRHPGGNESMAEAPHAEVCAARYPHLARLLAASPGLAPRPSMVLFCATDSDVMSTEMPLIQTSVSADLGSTVPLSDLVMVNCALDVSALQALSLQSLSLASSILSTGEMEFAVNTSALITDSSRIVSGSSQGVQFRQPSTWPSVSSLKLVSSLLQAGQVGYLGGDLTVGTNSFIRFSIKATLVASGGVTVANELSQVDVPSSTTQLAVTARNLTLLGSGRVLAGHVYVAATDTATIDGLLAVDPSEAFRAGDPCPTKVQAPLVQDAPCHEGRYNDDAGFPMWITARTLSVGKSGTASSPALRLCAQTLTVQPGGSVTASSLGCAGQTGYGAGESVSNVPSSGGGHGGEGGGAVSPSGGSLPGGRVYDNVSLPAQLGSAGGGPSSGGSGGGLVWIDAAVVVNDGEISCAGAPGSAGTDGNSGGGGSGGSLRLVLSQLLGGGTFDTSGGAGGQGGPSGSGGGGGGGGGLILVQWANNTAGWAGFAAIEPGFGPSTPQLNRFTGTLINTGGPGGSPSLAGEHGRSLSDPTCMPGYGGALCLPCGPGTAKAASGNLYCQSCPPGTQANGTGNTLCLACDGGSIARGDGNALCQPCPTGTLPNANRTACTLCAEGYGGPACGPCGPGTFQPAANANAPCPPCGAGTFAGTSASTACQPCGPGRFAPGSGSSGCDFCDVGTVSAANYTACSPCPGGTYAQSDSCLPCGPNSFSGTKATSCSTCAPGTFSLGNATLCGQCPPIPDHASFLPNTPLMPVTGPPRIVSDPAPVHGMCSFACDSDYMDWPRCVTPLALAWGASGGFYTLVVALALGAVAFLPSLVAPSSSRKLPLPPSISTLAAFAASAGLLAADGVAGGEGGGSGGGSGADSEDDPSSQPLADARVREALAYWDGRPDGLAPQPEGLAYTVVTLRHAGSSAWAAAGGASAAAAEGVVASLKEAVAYVKALAHRAAGRARGSMASDDDDEGTPYTSLGNHRDDEEDATDGFGGAGDAFGRLAASGSPLATPTAHESQGLGGASADQAQVAAGPYGLLGGRGASEETRAALDSLQRHLHRAYFSGCNTPAQPLSLAPGVPLELSSAVSEPEWADYAFEVSQLGRYRAWEAAVANALRALYLPAAMAFEASRRSAAIRRLTLHHSDFPHDFLRNTRARALGNCVRFGHSLDGSLAWVDILVSDPAEDTGGAPVGQPRLPAVLPLSGSGSFACPLHVDLADPLLASQLALASPYFRSIALGLNDVLRRLRGPGMAPGLVAASPPDASGGGDDGQEGSGGLLRGLLEAVGLAGLFSGAHAGGSLMRRIGSGGRLSIVDSLAGLDDEAGYGGMAGTPALGGGRRSGRSSSGSEAGVNAALHQAHGHHHSGHGGRSSSFVSAGSGGTGRHGDEQAGEAEASTPGAGCLACAGVNLGPRPSGQSSAALAAITGYLSQVNAELASRSAAAAEAAAALDAKRARIAAARMHSASGRLPPISRLASQASRPGGGAMIGSTPSSPPLPRFGVAMRPYGQAGNELGGSNGSLVDALGTPRQGPTASSAIELEHPSDSDVDEDGNSAAAEEEALAAAVRQLPFGFATGYEASLYLGVIPHTPGTPLGHPRLCLMLLPRDVPPGPDGSWPFYVPYGARALPGSNRPLPVGPAMPGTPALMSPAGPSSSPSAAPARMHPGGFGPGTPMSAPGTPPTVGPARGILRGGGGTPAAAAGHPGAGMPRRSARAASFSGSSTGRQVMFADETGAGALVSQRSLTGHKKTARRRGGCCAAAVSPVVSLLRLASWCLPSLRNSTAASWDLAHVTAAATLLVAADAVLTALAISCVDKLAPASAVYLLLGVPPLALVLSPLVGLSAIALGTADAARTHAAFTAVSIIPACVCLVIGGAYLTPVGVRAALLVPLALLAVKYATLPLLHSRTALLELKQQWRAWAQPNAPATAVLPLVRRMVTAPPGGHSGATGSTGAAYDHDA